jgi:hypothetical protein
MGQNNEILAKINYSGNIGGLIYFQYQNSNTAYHN